MGRAASYAEAEAVVAPEVLPREAPATRPGSTWVIWAGLAVVLIAAAVLSFDALRGLALAVRIPAHFAWLLPIAVDAGAAVSCAAWLSTWVNRDASSFARWMTLLLIVLTVAGNAAATGWHALAVAPPWWAAVVVGAIPPAVVGAVVHLAVLVGRVAPIKQVTVEEVAPHPVVDAPVDEKGVSLFWQSAPATTIPPQVDEPVAPVKPAQRPVPPVTALVAVADDAEAARLVAQGYGHVRLQRELEISEHAARQLIKKHRTNGHQVATS